MKVGSSNNTLSHKYQQLLTGNIHRLAVKQIDNVEDINYKGFKENHRISFQYNKTLERNVANVIDNSSGKVVKKLPSDAQVDQMIRMQRLKGLHIDRNA